MQPAPIWRTVLVTAFAVLAFIGVLGALPTGAAGDPNRAAPINASVTQTASLNWAGYADAASSNSVTYAAATWTEPSVTCASHGTQYAAFWVGIDGFNSNTVEQTGTLAICSNGAASYVAWWELFPLNSIQTIGSITAHAGDSFSASVTFSSSGFTMAISDMTTGKSFSTTGTQSGTARSSAECVAERPSSGGSLTSLANFGTMTFSTCSATISGTTAGIGAYVTTDAITMVNRHGAVLASVSATSNSGQTFSVTWHRSKQERQAEGAGTSVPSRYRIVR